VKCVICGMKRKSGADHANISSHALCFNLER
jgi:hypothetical protein